MSNREDGKQEEEDEEEKERQKMREATRRVLQSQSEAQDGSSGSQERLGGHQESDDEEEKERQKMREATRRVLQSQSEAQEGSSGSQEGSGGHPELDLREIDVAQGLERNGTGGQEKGGTEDIVLPSYEEAMNIIETNVDEDNSRPTSRPQLVLRQHSLEDNGFSARATSYQVDQVDQPDQAERRMSLLELEEGTTQERDESGSRLQRFMWRRMENGSLNQLCCTVVLVTIVLSVIVFLGVFPASFVYLDYDKIALKYNKVTGVVDRSTTYEFGCYILGPSVGFLEFDGTAHTVSKTHGVFTVDKMPITISYHVQYFLKEKEVGVLHSKFGMDYDSVIRSVIESEIKNSAVTYSVDQFRLDRSTLEKYFHRKLKYRLEGDCCPACCPSSCTNFTACSLCPPPSTCDQGFHVTVEYFHLGQVDIPSQVTERYLTRTLLKEFKDREVFIQQKVLETTKTLQLTKQIRNTAQEIQEAGNIDARKIGVVSSANYDANLTQAYISGLSNMFSTLKVASEEHKLSLMMIRALEDVAVKGNLYRTYGYDNGTMSLYTKGQTSG